MSASLPAYDLISLPGEGPEDVVVGADGLIYTGLLDGRILSVGPRDRGGARGRQKLAAGL